MVPLLLAARWWLVMDWWTRTTSAIRAGRRIDGRQRWTFGRIETVGGGFLATKHTAEEHIAGAPVSSLTNSVTFLYRRHDADTDGLPNALYLSRRPTLSDCAPFVNTLDLSDELCACGQAMCGVTHRGPCVVGTTGFRSCAFRMMFVLPKKAQLLQ